MAARTEVPPGIAALDALAGQLLLRAGVRIGVAHTIGELGSVHRLRHRHASSLPEALEPDPYDEHALQLAAWRGLYVDVGSVEVADAVELIAVELGVTRFTIYNYINELGTGKHE